MKIEDIFLTKEKLLSTKECKDFLFLHYPSSRWTRILKINNSCRFFVDEHFNIVLVTSIHSERDFKFIAIPVHQSRVEEFKGIKKIAKNYITHDYGEVYINLTNNNLLVVGGDGGIIYTAGKKVTEDNLDEFMEDPPEDKEFNEFPETKFINYVEYEAEYSPIYENTNYVYVCDLKLLD